MNAVQHHRIEEHSLASRERLTEQVEQLLRCEDADRVAFFSHRPSGSLLRVEGFADRLHEHLGDIDNGPECFLIQCLLAVGRGEHELAEAIYENHFRERINEFAEKIIEGGCMNRSERAIRMIDREVERIAVSQFPSDEFCTGLIQMAYAQSDISDEQERTLTERAAFVTRKRRDDLREQHIQDVIRRNAA